MTPAETQSAAQGKQKLVRERMEQVSERGADMAAGRESAANANTSAPVSKREAVPVKTKETYARKETPSVETQSAPQGKGKLIRERTEQVAGRRIDAGAQQSPAIKVKMPASTPEEPPVPLRTRETEIAAKPQNIAQGKSQAIRERTEQVAERPVDAVSVKRESVLETPAPTPERSPFKTKEAYLSTETTSTDTPSAAQVRQKAIRKHAERTAERRTEGDSIRREPAAVAETPKQNAAPVKTKEAYALRETPDAMPQTRTAVKERTAQIAERPALADSAKPEIPETPRIPVKTRQARIQSVGRPEPPLRSHDIPETAEAVQTERMPIKTKEAYAQQGASLPQSTEPEHG